MEDGLDIAFRGKRLQGSLEILGCREGDHTGALLQQI